MIYKKSFISGKKIIFYFIYVVIKFVDVVYVYVFVYVSICLSICVYICISLCIINNSWEKQVLNLILIFSQIWKQMSAWRGIVDVGMPKIVLEMLERGVLENTS